MRFHYLFTCIFALIFALCASVAYTYKSHIFIYVFHLLGGQTYAMEVVFCGFIIGLIHGLSFKEHTLKIMYALAAVLPAIYLFKKFLAYFFIIPALIFFCAFAITSFITRKLITNSPGTPEDSVNGTIEKAAVPQIYCSSNYQLRTQINENYFFWLAVSICSFDLFSTFLPPFWPLYFVTNNFVSAVHSFLPAIKTAIQIAGVCCIFYAVMTKKQTKGEDWKKPHPQKDENYCKLKFYCPKPIVQLPPAAKLRQFNYKYL